MRITQSIRIGDHVVIIDGTTARIGGIKGRVMVPLVVSFEASVPINVSPRDVKLGKLADRSLYSYVSRQTGEIVDFNIDAIAYEIADREDLTAGDVLANNPSARNELLPRVCAVIEEIVRLQKSAAEKRMDSGDETAKNNGGTGNE